MVVETPNCSYEIEQRSLILIGQENASESIKMKPQTQRSRSINFILRKKLLRANGPLKVVTTAQKKHLGPFVSD